MNRNTKEWEEKQKARGLLKRRRSKGDKTSSPNKNSPPHSYSPPQRKRLSTRSFANSNYQAKLMQEHGYDLESKYQRAMSHYNQALYVTERKSIKK